VGFTSFFAAIAFYSRLPVPARWALQFERVACFAPLVGILLGSGLGGLDWGLASLGMPVLSRSAVLVAVWLGVTGGLHLDGAIDAADGLAVPDASRRLTVMAESTVGAFGVMSGALLLLLKAAALSDLADWRWLGLSLAAGWGRWGQQVAIAQYPYLKPMGKGAFHKAAIPQLWQTLPSLLLLLGLSALPLGLQQPAWGLIGAPIAYGIAAWFGAQFGGHTGDTYGAVVEWTEALFLLMMVALQGWDLTAL
jgi:adenosylcobinamide-GDP ribazoletransferase